MRAVLYCLPDCASSKVCCLIRSATLTTSTIAATSCTRITSTPCRAINATAAAVPKTRSEASRPVVSPMKDFREGPNTSGWGSRRSGATFAMSDMLSATSVPNPRPGSRRIRSGSMPCSTARRVHEAKLFTICSISSMLPGAAPSPSTLGGAKRCIRTIGQPRCATSAASSGSSPRALVSLIQSPPASSPARAVAASVVSIEIGTAERARMPAITGTIRRLCSSAATRS